MEKNKTGVLLMAYGTPASLDEVEEYYTHIRRGRKPSPEQLQDLIDRYKAIGGLSPLNEITQKQARELEQLLNRKHEGENTFKVYLGMKHSHPFIADTVKRMVEDGMTKAVGLVLAPHYSVMSIGSYIKTAQEAVEEHNGPQISYVKSWHLHPLFLQTLEDRVKEALAQLNGDLNSGEVKVIFSAHSLPKRILEQNDPYPDQLKETAQAVADRLDLSESDWTVAWQSAGQTPEPWLGPDILDVIESLHQQGYRKLVSCPVGFVSDHLEVLYDIDIECRTLCDKLGMQLVRTRSLNADPEFIEALADIVDRQMAGE
ncbi:MAG: ferrochelatase [Bacillaceae bacterium]|nr:ferrochelatase [Bacillaceae bacterium]